ncbi:hypothetical protein P4S72_22305 [Vibrio sp. PP-XX7]
MKLFNSMVRGSDEYGLDEYGQTLDPAIFERVEWARTVTSEVYQQSLAEQARFVRP